MTPPGAGTGEGRAAKAASRTLDVLEFVERQTLPVSAAEISAACDIPRSTLHKLLGLLRTRGYLTYGAHEKGWSSGHRLHEAGADSLLFLHGMAVLDVFGASGGGLTEKNVVMSSGLPRALVARTLSALAGYGLLRLGSDGTYGLGRRLVGLASTVGWAERLQLTARPVLARLRDSSAETASLFVADADQVLYLDQVESHYDLRCRGWIGRRERREGTSVGAAFADPSRTHAVADAVETGVTAIACAVEGVEPQVGINIIGPSWRLEKRGVADLMELVGAAATEMAAAYAATREA